MSAEEALPPAAHTMAMTCPWVDQENTWDNVTVSSIHACMQAIHNGGVSAAAAQWSGCGH